MKKNLEDAIGRSYFCSFPLQFPFTQTQRALPSVKEERCSILCGIPLATVSFSGSPRRAPHKRFSLHKDKLAKIEDALIMEGIADSVELRHRNHKSCLLALTKDNMLLRIDLDTGQVMEQVYLGPTSIRYKKIQWNMVDESFTLCSMLFPRQPVHFLRQAGMEVTDVIQLTILSCLPLDFVCKMSVTRQVFGKDTVDAAIFLNLLMVMHSMSHVRMYSLETIMKQGCLHQQKLYDKLEDGTTYGIYPSPVTVSVKLEERPPCLFEVRCRNRDVMLTMPPCYYIMWPFGNYRGYCCFSLRTQEMVEGGCLQAEDSAPEERVSLHADDSGRIVHMKNAELRVLKLQAQANDEERKLVEDFVINFTPQPQSPILQVTQSGRIIKQTVRQDCSQLQERTVLTMMYSEDQDMMIVVSVSTPGCDKVDRPVVGFYNNWTGQLLRQFELEESLEETQDRSICYQMDTITHVFKTYQQRFECHVYKLLPLSTPGEEWKGRAKGGTHRRSTPRVSTDSSEDGEYSPRRRRTR
ncbi:DDB1- and CUL4-associated factor 17 isoform X2 [Aplysia californica]|uniref:DDB1- and CUL4-associated factor 17 isoform X2 n=1 Tax=Aplysia californica TaxID=6500 RepID=A0ABM1VU97_APLCA|nr:DDB1- and CUL4-associated factor 17 isoform X2 [Aplysia californica]